MSTNLPCEDPSNFEDWSVWRNFHEAGRLMTTHFLVFLPSVVCYLFPGALILVVYFQFLTEFTSGSWPTLGPILFTASFQIHMFLMFYSFGTTLHTMKAAVYGMDTASSWEGEAQAVAGLVWCCCGDGNSFGRRRLWARAVAVLCFLVYFLSIAPVAASVELGVPKWIAALFTPLLAAGLSLLHLYLVLLLNLVVRLWMFAAHESIDDARVDRRCTSFWAGVKY